MKVLVTGSRVYGDYDKVKDAILKSGANIVVHGNAKGADTLAKKVCLAFGLDERRYPANWDKYGLAAGPKRNQQMLDEEHKTNEPIDLVLAFPVEGSIGTYDMMERAKKAGIKVIDYTKGEWCPVHHVEDECGER